MKRIVSLLTISALLIVFSCAKSETTVKQETKVDSVPVELKTDDNIFPIYSDVYGGGIPTEMPFAPVSGAKMIVYLWEGTCKMKPVNDEVYKGKEALLVTAGAGTWFGFGFHKINPGSQKMVGFENGHLKFAIKAAPGAGDVKVLVKHSYQTESWLNLDAYGFKADGKWHEISIPLADFIPQINFKDVNIMFGMAQGNKFVPLSKYWIDEIYWTKN